MPQKILLKDLLFNVSKVEKLSKELEQAYPVFKSKDFVHDVVSKFPQLELKARIIWIAQCLKKYLPHDYKKALAIIIKALPKANNPDLSDNDFGDFIYAPYAEFVAQNGCTQEHVHLSLNALHEITRRFSAEDAIRYFINSFEKETLDALHIWSKDSHYHVRRLCSEGTRPKLPWSQKITLPISKPIPILEHLFYDKTRFVTRSVANHIHDISKIDSKLSIKTLKRWQKSKKQKPEEMDYIIRHALRTLIKQGNKEAFELLGFSHAPQITISDFIVPKKVPMNTPLTFSFKVHAKEDVNVIVDYILYFQNKAGKMQSKKVFKLTKASLAKNKPLVISKNHTLREHMTTRTLYRGEHAVEIQINGTSFGKKFFTLV